MPAPKKIDYARLEPGWRAGILSPHQLAAEYTEATGVAVSHTAIIKHFKKLGVTRDLTAKVKAKADSMVLESMVTGKVSVETTTADAEIINDGAAQIAYVRLSHRKDIGRARTLAMKLLGELEEEIGPIGFRASTMKSLADTLKTLIGLEREAFGLNIDDKPAGDALAALLAQVQGSAFRPVVE